MCPHCNTKLIPILYGFVDPKYVDMHKQGLVFLVSTTYHTKNSPTSYCKKCEESFDIKIKL
jgi:hypothetical protein